MRLSAVFKILVFVVLGLIADPVFSTVSTTSSSTTAQGNGVTTSFTYNFPMVSAGDAVITVLNTNVTPNTLTTLTPSQYTLTGVGSIGGTVTYPLTGSPLSAGYYITISRVVPLVQTVSISNQGPTFKAIEGGLDYLTYITQQLQSQINSLSVSTTTSTANVGRQITSGSTDTAIPSLSTIAWKSATASNKTENLYQCTSTYIWNKITVTDEIGTAQTYNIAVTPYSGDTNLGSTSAFNLRSNFASATLQCDGAGNWFVQ